MKHDITFTGRELTIMKAALLMAGFWSHRSSTALDLLRDVSRDALDAVRARLVECHSSSLRSAGVFAPAAGWTDDYVRARMEITAPVTLTHEEIELVCIALDAAHAEFGHSDAAWLDFRVAGGGIRPEMKIVPADLLALAARLRAV